MGNRLTQLTSSCQLFGKSVRDRDGDTIGHVADLILDLDEGRIAYVGILLHAQESGSRRCATIPWSAIYVDGVNQDWRVPARKTTLSRIARVERAANLI